MHAATPADPATKSVAGHRLDPSTIPLLLTLGLGVFAGALDLGVLSPALPALGIAFGVGARDLPWVFTLYLLANVVSIPIMTKLADRNGRRPVYIACVAIFAVGSAIAIASLNWPMFLTARAIQAFGAGGIFPVATAAIADRIPPERRGAALGLVAATWGVAAILGPLVGGAFTHFLSWHWIFVANIPLAIVVIAMARTTMPVTVANVRGPLDVPGIALLAAGLLGLMFGLTQYDVNGATSNLHARLWLTGGIVALIAFVFAERHASEPVIPPRFFSDSQLTLVYGLEILIGILEGALFFIPAALVAAEHLSYAAAGAIAAIGAVMFVVVIPGAGRALDAAGSRIVLASGTTPDRNRARHIRVRLRQRLDCDRSDGRRGQRLRGLARRAHPLHRHQPRGLEAALSGRRPAFGLLDPWADSRRLARGRRDRLAGRCGQRLPYRLPVVHGDRGRSGVRDPRTSCKGARTRGGTLVT